MKNKRKYSIRIAIIEKSKLPQMIYKSLTQAVKAVKNSKKGFVFVHILAVPDEFNKCIKCEKKFYKNPFKFCPECGAKQNR